MVKVRTHYDNLHVSRNAAPEVISAAYRTLSLKYHPDRNNGDARSQRIIRILNDSFSVLSDPDRRSAHDAWIDRSEVQETADEPEVEPELNSAPPQAPTQSKTMRIPLRVQLRDIAQTLFKQYWGILLIVVFFVAIGHISESKPQPSGLPVYDPQPSAEKPHEVTTSEPQPSGLPTYESQPSAEVPHGVPASEPSFTRPAQAPNGSPWPIVAGYIAGYPLLLSGGLSEVTIDNRANADDVFVKLVTVESDDTKPVRQFFIPAYGMFTVEHLTPGTFDIRYMNLRDGTLSRTPTFNLEEHADVEGTRYSRITMTLYTVLNGNMRTFPLLPSEF